jgi:hypothetical protein
VSYPRDAGDQPPTDEGDKLAPVSPRTSGAARRRRNREIALGINTHARAPVAAADSPSTNTVLARLHQLQDTIDSLAARIERLERSLSEPPAAADPQDTASTDSLGKLRGRPSA